MDLNISLIKKIFSLIDIEIVIKNTKEIYEFRELLDAKKNQSIKLQFIIKFLIQNMVT